MKEKKKSRGKRIIPFNKGNFVVVEEEDGQKSGKRNRFIAIYDSTLKKMNEVYKTEVNMSSMVVSPALNIKSYKHHMIEPFWGVECDRENKRIVVADSREGFYFEIIDEKGNIAQRINRKTENIRLTEAYKKEKFENFKKFAGPMWEHFNKRTFVFPDFFPSIRAFTVSDGEIYAATYSRKDNKTEFIVLDLKGKIIKKMFIPVRVSDAGIPRFTINKGKCYQIIDNEVTETWELHIHNIE